jgi:hypothetical protein
MKVEVYLKRVYGVDRYYPANTTSNIICSLMGSKTLNLDQLKLCREAGWEVKIVPEVLDL